MPVQTVLTVLTVLTAATMPVLTVLTAATMPVLPVPTAHETKRDRVNGSVHYIGCTALPEGGLPHTMWEVGHLTGTS
jgi:hypothetical protein